MWGRGRESQANSIPSTEPDTGLDLRTPRPWSELKPRVSHIINWVTQVLKFGVLKVSRFGIEPGRHCAASGEKAGKQPRGRQCENSYLKNAWDAKGDIIHSSRSAFLRAASMETPVWEQSSWLVPFPCSTPQHKHRTTCSKQHSTDTSCLTCLHQVPHPCALPVLPFLVKFASIPAHGPLP